MKFHFNMTQDANSSELTEMEMAEFLGLCDLDSTSIRSWRKCMVELMLRVRHADPKQTCSNGNCIHIAAMIELVNMIPLNFIGELRPGVSEFEARKAFALMMVDEIKLETIALTNPFIATLLNLLRQPRPQEG